MILHNEKIGRVVDLEELEMVVSKQMFDVAVPALESFLLSLVPYFPGGITIYCVAGNHGRLDKYQHASTTNFDTMTYKLLEARLQNQKTITWKIEVDSFYQKVTIWNKHTFLLTHGDCIKMWLNIPIYGITQRVMRWDGALPGVDFQYLCLGHFHVPSDFIWNDKRVFVNGCFVSDDQWVLKQIGMATVPAQTLFGVHPRKGVSWRYLILMDKWGKGE